MSFFIVINKIDQKRSGIEKRKKFIFRRFTTKTPHKCQYNKEISPKLLLSPTSEFQFANPNFWIILTSIRTSLQSIYHIENSNIKEIKLQVTQSIKMNSYEFIINENSSYFQYGGRPLCKNWIKMPIFVQMLICKTEKTA